MPNNLTLKSSSYTISAIGFVVGIFWLTLLSQIGILSFIDTFASFFGPIVGVVIIDFYLIKDANVRYKINKIEPYDSISKKEYPFSYNLVNEKACVFLDFLKSEDCNC